MLTTTCYTCHQPKADLRAVNCPACTTTQLEAEQHFAAENPNAAESDILYAGRTALRQRAHHANRNFIDPRDFSAGRGLIPTDTKRGSTDGGE